MLLIFIVTCIAVYYYTTSKPDNTRLKMKGKWWTTIMSVCLSVYFQL